jgi:EmrB/QacA subfamily drug resistance transporter
LEESIIEESHHKGMTLFVVVAMTFLATLLASIVNIALPVMAHDLAVPLSSIEWVIASYVMVICSTLLFFGRLGDIIGKSVVFRFGTVIFVIGTLLCGMCDSLLSLIICRFIEGIGAAAYMATNQGIIAQMYFNEGKGKAMGILAVAVALGTMTGSPLGGLIVSITSWNYIFYVNVPFGILFFIMGLKYLPKDKRISGQHIDAIGAVLSFAGTTLLFWALIQAQKVGFSNPYIMVTLLLSIIIITIFVKFEKGHIQPLLDINLFKNRLFSISLLCALISFICISAYTLLFPFYFEDTLKLAPSYSGFLMMIPPIIIAALSAFCGNLADKIGAEILTIIGLSIMAVSFFLMSFLNLHSSLLSCAIFLAIMAVGQAFFQPANNSLIMSACPKDKLGIGGSVNSWVRNLGQYAGVVLSTTFLFLFMSNKVGYPVSDYVQGQDAVFVYGMKSDFIILMGLCVLGVLITAYRYMQTREKVIATYQYVQTREKN